MPDLTLTPDELHALTGRMRQADQLAELHQAGFLRARLGADGRVILERAHYLAVCEGRFARPGEPRDTPAPSVRPVRKAA